MAAVILPPFCRHLSCLIRLHFGNVDCVNKTSNTGGTDVIEPLQSTRPVTQRPKAIVTGLPSDSHTWNLVYIQLYLEEQGYEVVNLGPCVTEDILIPHCVSQAPELIVMSTVNGHGHADGMRVIRTLRAHDELANVPAVIGGKLGVNGPQRIDELQALLDSGFDGVFDDSAQAGQFDSFLRSLQPSTALSGKRGALCS
jgi:methylaspartate mutase sigma subunit